MTKFTYFIVIYLVLAGAFALRSRKNHSGFHCITTEQEEEMFDAHDTDGNGLVDGEEFITAKCGLSEDPAECTNKFTKLAKAAQFNYSLILPAFNEFDYDQNDQLDSDEFHEFANDYACSGMNTNFLQQKKS